MPEYPIISDAILLRIVSTFLTACWICQISSLVCLNLVGLFFVSINAFELLSFARKLDVDVVSWTLSVDVLRRLEETPSKYIVFGSVLGNSTSTVINNYLMVFQYLR